MAHTSVTLFILGMYWSFNFKKAEDLEGLPDSDQVLQSARRIESNTECYSMMIIALSGRLFLTEKQAFSNNNQIISNYTILYERIIT
jgi:hypothetical protein